MSHKEYCLYEYSDYSPDIMHLETRGMDYSKFLAGRCRHAQSLIQCCHLWDIIKIKINTKMTLASIMIHILPDISVKQQ